MPRLSGAKFQRQGATVAFEMNGERLEGIEGESIAAALIAAGRMSLRHDKAGTPRGLFCGMGTCFECEVSIDERSPQRACLTKVRAGMRIRSVNYRVAPEADEPPVTEQQTMTCEVFIVGGGPAGLSAAIELAEVGVETVVADERPELGGQFFKQLGSSHRFAARPADAQYARGRALIDRVRESNVTVLSGACVWSASMLEHERLQFQLDTPQGPLRVDARYAVIATGAFDAAPAFEGWTLPGVMTTGAAQSLARSYRVAPGERVLIAGNGPLNLQLAVELLEGGVNVVGIAESAPRASVRDLRKLIAAFSASPALMMRGARYLSALRARNIPIWWQHRIVRAMGDTRVRHAVVAPIDSNASSETLFEIDALCVGYGFRPSNELARLLGCRYEATSSVPFAPLRDMDGRSSLPNVFIVGDCGVMGGAEVAIAEGALAANAIASELHQRTLATHRHNRSRLQRHRRFQRHLWSLFAAPVWAPPVGPTLVCRCERVSAEKITALVNDGVVGIDALKHATRVGMGPCQGRYCLPQVQMLSRQSAAADEHRMPTVRVPIKPTLIGTVAKEKPEWYGYKPVAAPPISDAHSAGSSQERAHVLVIGAGVIGVSTALYLARAGIDVIVIDQGEPNGGASGANAGSLHLQLLSWDIPEAPAARAIAAQTVRLQQLGIATWLELQQELNADFELQLTGGIALAESEADLEFLRSKAMLERRFGIDIELLNKQDLRSLVPAVSERMIGGTLCAGEGKINPMLATPIILREAQRLGVRLRSREAVRGIRLDRDEYVVSTAQGTIRCRKIVNAAGGWAAGIASMVGARLPVYSAPQQMIVTEATRSSIDYLLALARRHLTMKQASNGNLIIGGGWPARFDVAHGKAMTLPDSIEGNLWVAQRVIPELARLRMIRSWATLGVMIDGAPILGGHRGHPGFFNAVGANGFTMGPIMGRITAQLIAERDALTDIRPFSLDRFSTA